MGAFMSFTCGHFNSGGGIGAEIGRPADQNLFIGVKDGDRKAVSPIRCLPLLRSTESLSQNAAAYTGEQAKTVAANQFYHPYDRQQVTRHFGWGTDGWVTPDFTFTVHTPFGPIPEPGTDDAALRDALLPAVIATLHVDNRQGTQPRTAVFAIDFGSPGARLLHAGLQSEISTKVGGTLGFGYRRSSGVLANVEGGKANHADNPNAGLFAVQRWSVAEGLTDVNPVHMLGTAPGLAMEVPAGESRTLVLAIGVYLDGIVTTGLEGKYLYTQFYSSLDDVLSRALEMSGTLRARAAALDAELLASPLSADQQFMIAHATRSYYGSTQLLNVGGEPFWIVNEGEYCMLNTLDLSVDQVFWELQHNPWVVKNLLNNFSRHYAYHDHVQASSTAGPGGKLQPGGISFAHDMGVNNHFSPPHRSSYELSNLKGCFSFMTMEQLCNWSLIAACYVAKTGDTQWLLENAPLLDACAQSLRARSNPATGVMAHDSSLTNGGWEITTYDSLDESLGQARANTYLAVKAWAAATCLEMASQLRAGALGEPITPSAGKAFADRLAATLQHAASADGSLPAVLEKDNAGFHSRIFPVLEGLVYLSYCREALAGWSPGVAALPGRLLEASLAHPLVDVLRTHTLALFNDPNRRNLFPDGGMKLSSTSNNSWMSKIAIVMHVCRTVLKLGDTDPHVTALLAAADAAHVTWQIDGSGYWACSDQFINGKVTGSRYYPRIITAALWLNESATAVEQSTRRRTPAAI